MRSLTKFISSFFLITAVSSLAGTWDESPFASPKNAQERAADKEKSVQTGKPNEEGAPTAVRQGNEFEFVDPRDNQSYPIENFKGNTWMKKNLNYMSPESYCYENKAKNCDKAGRLYTWRATKHACPDGWRLPSSSELGEYLMHKVMISSVQQGGFRKFNGDFYEFNRNAYFWTSDVDPDYSDYAIYWSIALIGGWEKKGFYKDQAHSVRCIKGEDQRKIKYYRSNSKASAFDRI